MPLLKCCGSALILLSGILLGRRAAAFERARRRQAAGFLALITLLRRQIESYGTPIGEILSTLDPAILTACRAPARPGGLPALLAGTELLFPPEICRLLRQLACDLGRGGRGEQLSCIDGFLTRFGPYCEKLQTGGARSDRAALLLPVVPAALLALLLL